MSLRTEAAKPTVVILSGVRWSFLWQRHQTLATLFAGAGYPTVFVETTGLANPGLDLYSASRVASRLTNRATSARDGGTGCVVHGERGGALTVYSPLVAPPTRATFRALNARYLVPKVVRDLRRMPGLHSGERPVVLAYPPTRTTLQIASRLSPRLLYYDCSDEYAAFHGVPSDIQRTELELLLRSDIVSCTSQRLLDRIRKLRPDASLLGPGVDYEAFARPGAATGGRPREVREVCYFGDIGEGRISTETLMGVAGAGYRVRLIGELKGEARRLLRVPGIDYRGPVGHRGLPRSLEGVDALVLPYKRNALTDGVSPAKLYEYLATGLPVISSPLPSLEEAIGRGIVYPASNASEYISALSRLSETESEELAEQRRKTAEENSWENVFPRIEEVLWRELDRNPAR